MWGNPIQAVGARDFQTTVPAALHIEQAAIHPAMVLPLGTWARPSSELAWNIALTTLSLLFFYILFLSALPKFEHALEVNFLISPFIISFFAIVFGPVVLRSKFPSAFFGLQTTNWKSATGFSFLASLVFIGVGVALKWLLIHKVESFAQLSILGFADLRVNDQQIAMSPLYSLAVVLYLVLTPIQELHAAVCKRRRKLFCLARACSAGSCRS